MKVLSKINLGDELYNLPLNFLLQTLLLMYTIKNMHGLLYTLMINKNI